MLFHYPMIIHDEDGFWGEFPDVDGCNAQGDTLEEILEDAKGALHLHLSSMLLDGEKLNPASYPKDIAVDEHSFVTMISVDIDLSKMDKAVKKTLTIPSWLNEKAEREGINFSKTLQEALIEKLAM
ncbi:MAG: type II toxin-antitoxin system HicB family antitoxin [Peptostreptococcaceae bacterium]|nr:type II toxin-antitoxin system HicB family antitoxin [Peptostreptococcaceae bacterium]